MIFWNQYREERFATDFGISMTQVIKIEAINFGVSFIKAKKLKINYNERTTTISILDKIIEIQARQLFSIFCFVYQL